MQHKSGHINLFLGQFSALVLLVLSIACYYFIGERMADRADVVRYVSTYISRDTFYRGDTGEPLKVNVPETSKVQKTIPLSLPAKSIEDITTWASIVGAQMFTVDFLNINDQIGSLKYRFTEKGWGALLSALRGSGWLEKVVTGKITSTAVVSDSPLVLKHGVLNGAYSWTIQFPIQLFYESAGEARGESRVCTMVVRRVNFDMERAGIAIDSFNSQ
ncbi:DotI/IcmL family type IV secretion protein [Candidatus Synchoanobacter obligatus]|uniref:DotI/IcmL family type IV secretion protein n=1 Tax=Candidatus Synchoanobacter obligatus TaxID=2919597 RepID=A0ABT1L663_9GAMM|nr:DotI/IcmL family type IV secretion protein [Candidatus Synchoanobacter obligatus]MCP8352373.1 DotI/IcmL family type IV secretion protein [Candidatus Synchoanobacter obligatus]